MMTPRQVAERMGEGVTARQVRYWIHCQVLRAFDLSGDGPGRRWLVDQADLERFLESRRNDRVPATTGIERWPVPVRGIDAARRHLGH